MLQPPDQRPDHEAEPTPPHKEVLGGRDVFQIALLTLATYILIIIAFDIITSIQFILDAARKGNIDLSNPTETTQWIQTTSLPQMNHSLLLLRNLCLSIGIIIPSMLYLRKLNYSLNLHYRLRKIPSNLIIYALLIGLSIKSLATELAIAIEGLVPVSDEIKKALLDSITFNNGIEAILIFFTIVVFAPVFEEMLFRGLLQRWLERVRGVTDGVLWASAIFAALHIIPQQLLPIIIMAVILGAITWRAESVWPAIAAHAANNFVDLLLANSAGEEAPSWLEFHGHVAPWLLLPALLILVWAIRRYFDAALALGLGGHSPKGDAGNRIDTTA